MENSRALSTQDVAERLRVSKSTVYNLINQGDLAFYKIGRKLRFTEEAINDYIRQSQTNQAPSSHAAPVNMGFDIPMGRKSRDSFIICGQDLILDVLSNYLHLWGIPALRYYIGSYDSLVCLYKDKVNIASAHLWDGAKNEYNVAFVKRLLAGIPVVIVHLACRMQGFYVQAGNPKNITQWTDLLRNEVTIINREYGSGSRVLLDENLKLLKVFGSAIHGYQRECQSHLAVASAVSGGQADVGLGIEKIARQVDNIEFVPLQKERYDIAFKKEDLDTIEIQTMLKIIKSPAFQHEFTNIGGYDITDMGQIVTEV